MQQRGETEYRPGAILRVDDRRGNLRGRLARPQNVRHALSIVRECEQPGRGLRAHRGVEQIRCEGGEYREPLLAACETRSACEGNSPAAHSGAARFDSLLPFYV